MTVQAPGELQGLLATARTGDAESLGMLLERYREYLTVLARVQIGRRLQRKVEAGDLVQETFLEAHRAFGRFRGRTEAEFAYWLRQILAARIAMLIRHYFGTQRRNAELEIELAHELDESSKLIVGDFVASDTSPSMGAARREQATILADALTQLPDDYHTVIRLRHLEGMTFPAVAREMGRSVDAVEKLWARALVQLRRIVPPPG